MIMTTSPFLKCIGETSSKTRRNFRCHFRVAYFLFFIYLPIRILCNLRSCYCIWIVHTNVAGFLYGAISKISNWFFFRQIFRPQSTWQRNVILTLYFNEKIAIQVLSIKKRNKYTKTRKNFDFPLDFLCEFCKCLKFIGVPARGFVPGD